MKNSTLLFRSLLIVAIIAGIPHALAIYAKSNSAKAETEINAPAESEEVPVAEVPEESWEQYWPGKYEVSFEGIAEKAVYEIRQENNQFKTYSVELIDNKGNRFKDNSLVMEQLSITDNVAEADYQIEYEGEKYTVGCRMEMDDEGNVVLTYKYYSYEGKETWKRIQ